MADARAAVAALSLRDFRNFERLELDIPREGCVLVGDNGHGKTNLLESVYYLSLLRSGRGVRDVDVTRHGAEGFYIEGHVCAPAAHVVSVGFERAGRRKKVKRDGVVLDRLSDALGAFPAVMFSPFDVALIAGAPSERRRFMDIMLALSSRPYLLALQQYRGALDRRNAALRETTAGRSSPIDVWEPALAEHGARLMRERRAWVAEAATLFAQYCESIGETAAVSLSYGSAIGADDAGLEEALAQALAEKRTGDVRLGVTRVGPHRDDLVMMIGGRDLRVFGSAGQQRTAAIALRALEARTLRRARDAAPVFLMDDPFAELDVPRSARVLSLLGDVGLGQTILAVPRDSDIPRELTSLPRLRVIQGRIEAML